MKKLFAVYADAGVVVRTKAPQVFVVLVVILALLPIIVVSDLLAADFLNAGISSVILVTMVAALVALFRGRYRFASVVPLVVATVAVIGLAALVDPVSRHQVYTVAMYLTPPLLLSLAMSENEWFTVVVAGIGVATILVVSLVIIAPALPALGDTVPIAEQLMIAIIIYLLLSAFSVLVAAANRRAVQSVEAGARRATETLKSIAAVSSRAQSSMSSSRSVETDYDEVRTSIEEISRQISLVERAIVTLRENMANALGSVRSTADRVVGFHAQVDEQNTVVQESTAAVNEMAASLDSVAQITASKRQASETLLSVVDEGLRALAETNESFQTASREMGSLLEINEIIGDIAAQTNLLSMNAAIEAAHAGDSGRGFAVVAEEIRKLASSTGENSQIISENLKRLMDSISRTSKHAQTTTEVMSRISGEVREVAQAFAEITGSTAELSQGGREIMNAMQVLQDSSVQVRDGSDQISRDQQAARGELDQVGALIQEIESASEEVGRALASITETMGHLQSTISTSSAESVGLHHSINELVAGLRDGQ